MYYSYVEIEYVATSFSPARMDLALKLLILGGSCSEKIPTLASKIISAAIVITDCLIDCRATMGKGMWSEDSCDVTVCDSLANLSPSLTVTPMSSSRFGAQNL
jgi:hypothetical protein